MIRSRKAKSLVKKTVQRLKDWLNEEEKGYRVEVDEIKSKVFFTTNGKEYFVVVAINRFGQVVVLFSDVFELIDSVARYGKSKDTVDWVKTYGVSKDSEVDGLIEKMSMDLRARSLTELFK